MASLGTTLPHLSDREAIADALYRAILGIDTNDNTLFDSAFMSTASFGFTGAAFTEGRDAMHAALDHVIQKLDTTHFLTNLRLSHAPGENAAKITCSAMAQHYRAGEGMKGDAPRLLTGALYFVDLVKDDEDGLWKVQRWEVKLIWAEGERDVMRPV